MGVTRLSLLKRVNGIQNNSQMILPIKKDSTGKKRKISYRVKNIVKAIIILIHIMKVDINKGIMKVTIIRINLTHQINLKAEIHFGD